MATQPHISELNLFKCKFKRCSKVFKTSQGRSKHYRTFHKDVYILFKKTMIEGKHKCKNCDLILSSAKSRFSH